MDFEITQEQQELKDRVVRFARSKLNGDLLNEERNGQFSWEKWRLVAAFGIQGLCMPAEFGGSDYDLLTTVYAMESLGYGCHDNGLIFSINGQMWSTQVPILKFGTAEQKARYLPVLVNGDLVAAHAITEEGSGSDAFNIRTSATKRRDRYIISGSETFITNAPVAGLFILFASVDRAAGAEGISAFLLEKDAPGFSVSNSFDKMGLRTSPMGEIFLDGCEIPESQRLGDEGAGIAIFNCAMNYERPCLLAASIGTLQRQLETCIARGRSWERFGKPIGKFQSVSNRIVDKKVRLETARLLLYRTAWRMSRGERADTEAAMAKLYVSECAVQSSLDAIQIFGAAGYMSETGVERDLRDAVAGTIYSGTSDIQRLIIARHLGL